MVIVEQFGHVICPFNDLDVMITDTRFITGKILGDGLIQVVTTVDGLDEVESQLIESNLKSGHFTLKYNNTTRVDIAYNAEAEDVEVALRGIILNSDFRVSRKSIGNAQRYFLGYRARFAHAISYHAS